jgi:drug/metabolite transporter (DMT)-like permease
MGILGTGLAYVLNYRIIHDDAAVMASVVTYLLPVIAIVLGWLVLSEEPKSVAIISMAVVLIGVGLARRRTGALPIFRDIVSTCRIACSPLQSEAERSC